MGKRKHYATLSHFAKQAFQTATDASSTDDPAKKSDSGSVHGTEKNAFDASSLVPHYKASSEVPEHLQKYFSQRKRYFSLYDQGCLLDEEGWYSVTPELIADQIAERCRCDTVLDAFCGVGGNAIAFAKTCNRVIALDNSPTRLALARHNALIYGVADRIDFILADYIAFANTYLNCRPSDKRPIDVVFLSPPWGGPDYISQHFNDIGNGECGENGDVLQNGNNQDTHPEFSLANIGPIHGADLFQLTRRITKNVAYFLPRNANLDEISALLLHNVGPVPATEDPAEMVEVEEEWMGTKLKALTCYFGGLAGGQEHLF